MVPVKNATKLKRETVHLCIFVPGENSLSRVNADKTIRTMLAIASGYNSTERRTAVSFTYQSVPVASGFGLGAGCSYFIKKRGTRHDPLWEEEGQPNVMITYHTIAHAKQNGLLIIHTK